MLATTFAAAASRASAQTERSIPATLYKTPDCGCCEDYAQYLRRNGLAVETVASHDIPLIKKRYRVPEKLEGCHTTIMDEYVIEGHVPIDPTRKMLAERPPIRGISLPGMPEGSPGMTGRKTELFAIYVIEDGDPKVYARV
jgi:hypothetical protein